MARSSPPLDLSTLLSPHCFSTENYSLYPLLCKGECLDFEDMHWRKYMLFCIKPTQKSEQEFGAVFWFIHSLPSGLSTTCAQAGDLTSAILEDLKLGCYQLLKLYQFQGLFVKLGFHCGANRVK